MHLDSTGWIQNTFIVCDTLNKPDSPFRPRVTSFLDSHEAAYVLYHVYTVFIANKIIITVLCHIMNFNGLLILHFF